MKNEFAPFIFFDGMKTKLRDTVDCDNTLFCFSILIVAGVVIARPYCKKASRQKEYLQREHNCNNSTQLQQNDVYYN